MKILEFIDEQGFRHRRLVRDLDNDPRIGVPQDPPDLNQLDWEAIKRDIHNQLVEQNLITWTDVQRAQSAVSGIVLGVVRKQIIYLYKEAYQSHGN